MPSSAASSPGGHATPLSSTGGERDRPRFEGSDAPEKRVLRVGFVPLSDCAPLVAAVEMGFDERYGIRIELCRQPSWAAVRDKLLSGELDAAHARAGLAYGVELGIGGPQHPMAVLMTLNQNGQAITLSRALAERDVLADPTLPRPVFAHTFPTGSHAMWLYYWLAAQGIDPLRAVDTVVIPPPQMAAAMLAGELDGFCAGEPWSALAESNGAGVTWCTTDSVWPDHPEKVLTSTRGFVTHYPHAARALVMALLEACRALDRPDVRARAAGWLARPDRIDAPQALIAARLGGDYRVPSPDDRSVACPTLSGARALRFFGDGEVNLPYLSDAIWFMTQYRRWGMLAEAPDYQAVAAQICQTSLFRNAASQLHIALPATDWRTSVLMDGIVWNGAQGNPWV